MLSIRDILRPGLTGCTEIGGQAIATPHAREAIDAWKAACYDHTRRSNARIDIYEPDGPGRNYHTLSVRADGRSPARYELLLHSLLPFVGARTEAATSAGNTAIDVHPLDAPEFIVLPATLLNTRAVIEPWMEGLVDPQSWADMLYWEPPTVLDLVFNMCD